MIQAIARPEILFLLGTLQALLPYFTWAVWGIDVPYDVRLTYKPFYIYVAGYLCFLSGTLFFRGRSSTSANTTIFRTFNPSTLLLSHTGLMLITVFALVGMLRAYGTIPLMSFLSGTADVNDANDILEDTFVGQVAIAQIAMASLTATLAIICLRAIDRGTFNFRSWTVWPPLLLLAFGYTMGGKRQGLIMAVIFLLTAILLASPSVISRILRRFHLRTFTSRLLLGASAILAGLFFFEYVGAVRSDRDFEFGFNESLRYLELPLINLEYQCDIADFGPRDYLPTAPLQSLFPRRMELLFPQAFAPFDRPPRLEPTATAGFYGELQWFVGLPGCLAFAFAIGGLSKFLYTRSSSSPLAFLCYCQISWPLFSCHSYNHFCNLVFVPLPLLAHVVLVLFLKPLRDKRSPSASRSRAPAKNHRLSSLPPRLSGTRPVLLARRTTP